MEDKFTLTDDQLWDYADGLLPGEEQLRIEAYLRQNPGHQARLDVILSEKRAFSAVPLGEPDAGFAQRVMAAWAAEQAPAMTPRPLKAKGRDWILWCIVAGFGLMIAVPFLMSPSAAPTGFEWQVPEEYIPRVQIPRFDWAGVLGSAWLHNAILLTLAFMGLKLLDKYLQVRNMRLT